MDIFKENLFKYKLNVNYKTLAIYNLPTSFNLKDVTQKLENLDIDFNTISYIPTYALMFRNSCHICQINYKDIFSYDYCLLLTIKNCDNDKIIDEIKSLSDNINVKLICQINLCKDLVCPLMIEQQNYKINFEDKIINVVEQWFADEEIYKHKDILVSMNNYGWVPLTVIETKFEEMIVISSQELSEKLRQSKFLILDSTEKLVRRRNAQLPYSDEHKQIVLLDIPDQIKSIRQMPAYLQIEGSNVEYFDYAIHAAIITLSSREEAKKLVADVLESDKMKAKLLVPCIIDDSENLAHEIDDVKNVVDVQKMLASLALKQQHQSIDQVHSTRLSPKDLLYSFKSDFCPPSDEMIDRIVQQCNFYFSDENVLKDLFILKKIKSNPGGWIELQIIANFKQIVKLSENDVDKVVYAMCFSDQVQISRDARCLRRRLPLPEWDSSIYIRSLFLWNLPRLVDSYEMLDHVFRDEGRFLVCVSRFIRIDRNVPADLRKLCDKIPALGKYNCGVVEFKTRESMLAADEFIHMKWASVKSFYLDTKEELPKPAVIIGKLSKCLPPPIPVSTFLDDRVAPLQAGTRIDPRFWQVARLLSSKKRAEMKIHDKNELTFGIDENKKPINKNNNKKKREANTESFNITNENEFPSLNLANKKQVSKKRGPFKPVPNKKSKSKEINKKNKRGKNSAESGKMMTNDNVNPDSITVAE